MTDSQNNEFIPGVSEYVHVTPKAVKEIEKIMAESNLVGSYGLRVGVRGGGCSGLTYTLGFDCEERPTDEIIEIGNIKILIDMKSFLYLQGTEIDYSDGLTGKGFIFNNPNAKKTCGCGSSFGI